MSYLAFLSVFVGKFSDGLLAKELLDNMSQEAAKGDAPGRLSPLKQADAEVQKICDQVSQISIMSQLPHEILFLSPLNFKMPCLAIADNPRNARWTARCVGIIVSIKLISRGGSRGRVQGVRNPACDDLRFSNTTGILQNKLCGLLEETSAPPPRKILDPPLIRDLLRHTD